MTKQNPNHAHPKPLFLYCSICGRRQRAKYGTDCADCSRQGHTGTMRPGKIYHSHQYGRER